MDTEEPGSRLDAHLISADCGYRGGSSRCLPSYAASNCTAIPDNEVVAGVSKASNFSASATVTIMMTRILNE